jgi:hypothetical protein
VHDGVSIGGGSIEAEQRCVTFGVGGRTGTDPWLGVGFPCTCLFGEAPIAPNHTPQNVFKSQSALGFCSVKDVCFSSGSASGLLYP